MQGRDGMGRYLSVALLAAPLVMAAGLAAAQAPLPTNNPEALANVRASKEYSAVLRSNPGFRQKRMQIECDPITDPQLHASCIASFNAYK
jgi:hypothetical protein